MLQRIQSVLLLVTAIAMGVFLGTNSFVKSISPTENIAVNPFHVFHQKGGVMVNEKPVYYVALVAGLAILLAIFTIFQYRNRVRQMLLVALNSLFIGVALAITVYNIQQDPIVGGADAGSFQIGMWAAFVALLCNWLANRFIKKDEKLVKDADRMR